MNLIELTLFFYWLKSGSLFIKSLQHQVFSQKTYSAPVKLEVTYLNKKESTWVSLLRVNNNDIRLVMLSF